MKKINVTIKGICPLLQHRFRESEHGAKATRSKKKVYDEVEEAEKALYKDSKGIICHPSEHIFASMIKAGVYFKFEGKKTFKDIIKGGVIIEPDMIPLNKDTYDEIDSRAVVIQRARVMCWRPKFNDWELTFDITILDEDSISTTTLKEILEFAGARMGIGDYRPRFGRFQIIEWKEEK